MKLGARTTAERLHAAGVSRVFWIRYAVMGDAGAELFASTIVPVLALLDSSTTVSTEHLKNSISTLAHQNEWGLVQIDVCVPWTPFRRGDEETQARSRLHLKAPPEPFSNLGGNINDLTVLACDIPYVVDLERILQADGESKVFVSGGADLVDSKRRRSVALAACESFMLSAHAKFEAVYRIANASDLSALQATLADVSKAFRLLLWVDLGGIDESCVSSFLSRLGSRFRHVSCVMTHDGTSNGNVNELLDDHDFHEFRVGDVNGIPGVTAASLHDEIKIVTNVNLFSSAKKQRRAVESAIGRPIWGFYHDDTIAHAVGSFISCIRIHITDVGYLHKLRDRVLTGAFEKDLLTELQPDCEHLTVAVDKSHFAARYEDSILSLDSLTPHQTVKLAECPKAEMSHIHIRAPAGAGKTFIALYLMLHTIREVDVPRILFVAPQPALTFFVAKWLWKRLEDDGEGQRKAIVNLYVMAAPDERQSAPTADDAAGSSRGLQRRRPSSHSVFADLLQLCRVDVQDDQIIFHPIDRIGAPTFDMVVVDESHHLYRDKRKREIIEHHVSAGGSQRVLLSDVSQSAQGQADTGFPSDDGIINVELTEVVRSSKRIVAGAMAFQVEAKGEESLTKCHHESTGPPLKTFLFDVHEGEDMYQKYAEETVGALETVIGEFPDLDLDDRVAIIVPDFVFEESLKPLLSSYLASTIHLRNFKLATAVAASSALRQRGQGNGTERLILSPIGKMDGLERLIIIAVGLDTVIDNKEHDDEMVLETRSRLYRAFTRAHMMVRLRPGALRLDDPS